MKFKYIMLIILASLLPLMIIPIMVVFLRYIAKELPLSLQTFISDYFGTITLSDFLSLYISILGVIATIVLTYLIYRLERNNEEFAEQEEINRIKRTLRVLLDNGINRAIKSQKDNNWLNFDFIRVTDNHIDLIASIGYFLSEKQFLYLHQVMETLKEIAEYEKESDPFEAKKSVNKLLKLVTVPVYPMYRFHFKDISSTYDVMSEEMIDILNTLAVNEEKVVFDYGITRNSDGKKLYKSFPNCRYIIYDESENIIGDAIITKKGVIEGEAQIYSEEGYLEFEGLFVDRKRHGAGVEYFYNGRKRKEGIWKADRLVDGTIYDVILDDQGTIMYEPLRQVESSNDLGEHKGYSSNYKIGNVRITNDYTEVIEESIRDIEEFSIDIPDIVTSLLNELQSEVMDFKIDTSTLIRKLQLVARKLNNKKLEEWCNREINGYSDKSGNIPDYRNVAGEYEIALALNYWRPGDGISDNKILFSTEVAHPLPEIEEFINGNEESFVVEEETMKSRIAIKKETAKQIIQDIRLIILDLLKEFERNGETDEEIFNSFLRNKSKSR